MDVTTALFFVFSAVLLFAAFRVITARNPVYAALYLVLAFFQASAIWMMLSAEFLAITLVLVYVGAVMVLFLFVVMMLDINVDTLREGFWKHFPLAAGFGVLIALEMSAVLLGGFRATEIAPAATAQVTTAKTTASAPASATALTTASQAASAATQTASVLATATASEPASNATVASTVTSATMVVSKPAVATASAASSATATISNTRALGILLYTEYLFPLEIAAVILLVAIITAIALTLRDRKDSRYVNPAHQVRVKAKDRLSVVQVSATLPASMRPADAATTNTEEAKS
jgi:NADH-quinone oxidoreductase subunit J